MKLIADWQECFETYLSAETFLVWSIKKSRNAILSSFLFRDVRFEAQEVVFRSDTFQRPT
jgi:hypothetical protein